MLHSFQPFTVIESGGGSDIIIGDDIRGFSAFDMTQFDDIEHTRQEIDNLIVDLSVRLSMCRLIPCIACCFVSCC